MIQNKRILITGAGGFIGTHLASVLHSQGNFVRAVDIKWNDYIKEPYYSDKLTLDLREYHNCLTAAKGIDYVFNLAANMGGIGFITCVGADIMHDNSLINTNMLEAAVKNRVKRFFFPSSACVYPIFKQMSVEAVALKEDDAYPAQPGNFYGWEKLFTEKMCEAYKRDCSLETRVARFHTIYGPGATYKGGREKSLEALCRKVAEATNAGEIEIWGDGKQTRTYCYIDDCVRGIIMLMESDYDKPINIGSDRLITIDELTDIIIKISGKKITKKYNLDAPQGARGRQADLTLAKNVLQWESKISLEEGIEKTYKWIESQLKPAASFKS